MSKAIPKLRFKEFKEEWEQSSLGDIAKFSKGKGLSKSDLVENGRTECVRYGELYTYYGETISEVKSRTNVPTEDLVLSEANDVIIPASGETQIDIATASCVLRGGIALGGDLNIIKTRNNGLFLSYYLNNKRKYDIASLAQGISVVHLYSSQLALLSLNIPTLPEQQKIASFLSAVDEKIQQLTRKKEMLEHYKKGVMQRLFCLHYDSFDSPDSDDLNTGDKTNHNNQKNHKKSQLRQLRFKDENGKTYPKWEEKRLGDVADFYKGKGISKNDITEDGNLECIRYGELYTTYAELIEHVVSKTNLPIKDLFLSEYNDVIIPSSGETQIEIATASCVLKSGVALGGDLNVIRSKMNGVFLSFYLNFQKKQDIAKLAQGSSVVHLYSSQLQTLKLELPCIEEQNKIASYLSAIDAKIESVANQITQTQTFKKGLLQQMFV